MKRFYLLFILLTLILTSGKKDFYKIPKEFAFIPMGSMEYNGKTISTDAFIMQKTEVSNKEYKEFLADLKANDETEKLKIAQIDSTKWRKAGDYNEPYVEFYHKHPAYDNYPVVNVSREAVRLYCEWLSNKWEKEINQKVNFRLPTENEWVYAAKGGTNNKFPWKGNKMTNKKGMQMCNYKHIEQYNIRVSSTGKVELLNENLCGDNQYSKILTPVDSYFANNYDLYNMSGNAAEMTADDNIIKGGSWNSTGYYMLIESESEYTEKDIPSAYVGFRVVYTYDPTNSK